MDTQEILETVERWLEIKTAMKEMDKEMKALGKIIVDNEELLPEIIDEVDGEHFPIVIHSSTAVIDKKIYDDLSTESVKLFAEKVWKHDLSKLRALINANSNLAKYLIEKPKTYAKIEKKKKAQEEFSFNKDFDKAIDEL